MRNIIYPNFIIFDIIIILLYIIKNNFPKIYIFIINLYKYNIIFIKYFMK